MTSLLLLRYSFSRASSAIELNIRTTINRSNSLYNHIGTMATNNNGITIHNIRPLNHDESKYVRPMRMHFNLNGKDRTWDCLKAHDSVSSVIYNKTRDCLIFVRQFRPAVYLAELTALSDLKELDVRNLPKPTKENAGYTMELCAGLADKEGKTTQEVMQEEIEEETGYKVPLESVKFISSFRGSTGLSGTKMSLFYCEVTDEQKIHQGGGVDDEAIEVMELKVEDARKFLHCPDEEAPFSRPPAMLYGCCWFLTEQLPKIKKS